MPVIAAASAAAAAGAGGTLFNYNRENYLYDRKMRQETEYQIMDFRIKQAELWREDVRDIIGLTSVKMDTYLIVNAVQLGFTVMAFCEGRLASGTPAWLVGCHTLSLAGAFMYLLMSVWFSMHASITAKSYETRLLTQLVRLPVPSWSQLEGARTYGSTFEKTTTKQMLRVPFVMGTQQRVLNEKADGSGEAGRPGQNEGSGALPESADLWGLEGNGDKIYELDGSIRTNPDELRHLQLIKQVMKYWQSYDGFARVAMSMGTNQLILGLSYYVIGYVLISNKAIMACWLVVLLFMVIATALIRLDMSLTGLEFRAAVVLVSAGPALTALAAQQWRLHTVKGYEIVHLLAPLPYAAEAAWLMLLLYISKVGEQEGGAMLPTGFRSVMYIDVFGWIKRARAKGKEEQEAALSFNTAEEEEEAEAAAEASGGPEVAGKGPAMAAASYEGRLLKAPKASRPEELPGAAKPPPEFLAKPEMFDPTTFVPREKDGHQANHDQDIHPYLKPGLVPWRIFCSATSLLLILWWTSGLLILLQASGWSALRVSPLLRDSEEGPKPIEQGAFLLEEAVAPGGQPLMGEHIETSWPFGAAPKRLACAADGGAVSLAASSRFGLFEAELQQTTKTSGVADRSADFRYAPACDALEGEALQDVAVDCQGRCALLLHRQGRRLTRCALKGVRSEGAVAMSLSDGWLGEGDAAAGEAQEEVSSLALLDSCGKASGSQRCAYAETTSGRLVELKSGLEGSMRADWLPTRVLMADSRAMRRGGDLHILGDRFLGLLAGNELRVFDVQNSGGKLLGRWPLPTQRRWTGMCSAGGSLFLLSEDSSPQLFRFPLPKSLLPASQSKPKLKAARPAPAASHNHTDQAGPKVRADLRARKGKAHGILAAE
ncbi:unnamed protein product [Effrenium voratum]|nr:unnamed protein product [Effrenium voratum]